MTFATVQDGLANQIKALDHFDDRRVSLNDWDILSQGVENAAILEYQEFELERDSSDIDTLIRWMVRINLLVRYTEDSQANKDMRDRRDEIILRILQNPTLPNDAAVATAFDSTPVSGGLADEEIVELGGVRFLKEFINVVIEERVNA